MNYYFRRLQAKEHIEEWNFATDDTVVNYILKIAIDVSISNDMRKMMDYLAKDEAEYIEMYDQMMEGGNNRQFLGYYFKDPMQRNKLISEYEALLL